MRGYKQSDAGGEEDAAKYHGEENRPAKSGATVFASFESKDFRGGLCADQTGGGPALGLIREARARVHGLWRPFHI